MSRRTSVASKAIREAWAKEQKLVLEGRGTRDWTPEQQRSIIEHEKAYDDDGKAFHGHHMKSAEAYPEYQDDADNIQFLTRKEHLDAHNGCFRNPTNGYYNVSTGVTRDFGEKVYSPCEVIDLSNPVVLTERRRAIESKYSDKKEEFRRQTMNGRDSIGCSEETTNGKMQKISSDCDRKEDVTGAKLYEMSASLGYAQELICKWDQLEIQITQYKQEISMLVNSIQQISNTVDGSNFADNPQDSAALQQMRDYRARIDKITEEARDASVNKNRIGEELDQSRRALKDNISNIEPDYLENKELRELVTEYRKTVLGTIQKANKISGLSYGSSFAKVVDTANDQLTALDSYYERLTALMRRTVELVNSLSSCITEINRRIGDEEDTQYAIGEMALHRKDKP